MARRKLSEKHVNITMPVDMAQMLQRHADQQAMKLGPLIRRICQLYLNQQAAQRREREAA